MQLFSSYVHVVTSMYCVWVDSEVSRIGHYHASEVTLLVSCFVSV